MRHPEIQEYKLAYFHGAHENGLSESDELVAELNVQYGNQSVNVPPSVYRDLANIYKVDFETTTERISLLLSGGDASSSYIAVVQFVGSSIIARKVSSRNFPDEAYESTAYSYTMDEGQ